jgi:hypothetical protein
MKALILCHAPEDGALARSLGDYLSTNLAYDVCYDEQIHLPGSDLIDATERALSADAALILLSPRSVPKTWNREKWEPVFFHKPAEFGSLLGFVLLEPCKFPDLLRRHRFFDVSADLLSEARRIRRWLLRPGQQPPQDAAPDPFSLELRASIGDRPGVSFDIDYSRAQTFAKTCAADFEAVRYIDCLGRSHAGILGDIGHAVGLRLAGTVRENRAALSAWADEHRCLLLIQNATPEDREFLALGGRVSTIFTTNAPLRERPDLDQIAGAFLAVPRDEALCASLTGDAALCVTGLLDSDFESGLRLGWALVGYLRAASRFAEVVEVLDGMEKQARKREDALALYRIGWEQSWLRETSPEGESVCILPTASDEVTQLSLF